VAVTRCGRRRRRAGRRGDRRGAGGRRDHRGRHRRRGTQRAPWNTQNGW